VKDWFQQLRGESKDGIILYKNVDEILGSIKLREFLEQTSECKVPKKHPSL
jgi:hypothetical protein